MVISLACVFLNKYVLSNLEMPLSTLIVAQSAFTCVVTAVRVEWPLRMFRLRAALTTGILFGVSLTLSNFSLRLVPVYCFQITRSLTVVMTFATSVFLLGDQYSIGALLGCAFVVVGFIGAVYDPRHTCGAAGFAVGTLGSVFVAAYAFFAQRLSKTMSMSDTMFYTNASVVLLLLLPAAYSLFVHVDDVIDASPETLVNFSFLLGASCVGSIAVNWATLNQLKVTSPLSHTLSTTFKSVAQTALDAALRDVHVAPAFVLASLLVFSGSYMYAMAKGSHVAASSTIIKV